MDCTRQGWQFGTVRWYGTVRLSFRGGVEDTRLEAKAKDTKINPRPRTAFPRTDTPEAKDRNAWGQGQGPRTQAQVLASQKFFRRSPKKKVFTKIFQAISTKKRFPKNFSSASQNFNNSKNSAVLEPRTGQFSRTWGQGQGLQNLSSRPRTSSRTPPVLSF